LQRSARVGYAKDVRYKKLAVVLFGALLLADVHAVYEIVVVLGERSLHHKGPFWLGFGVVAVIDAALVWITVRVGSRLRSGS
jgi:hypothetical protein